MDEDADTYGERKERSAKKGRRARQAPEQGMDMAETIEDAITQDDIPAAPSRSNKDSDGPPRPSRRRGGWGEEKRRTMEELDDGDTQVKSAFGDDDNEDPFGDRLGKSKAHDSSDDESDIPVIPELEDAHEEDSTQQIAVAPNVVINRVATYRELDNDLLRHAQFLTLDNEIDLKLLAKGLSAEQDIFEEDAPWDWERLFTEVTSELLTEWEKNEAKETDTAAS